MAKKTAKLLFILLVLAGLAIAAFNFFEADLKGVEFKQVTWHPEEPDCYGPPNDCIDMTSTKPPK